MPKIDKKVRSSADKLNSATRSFNDMATEIVNKGRAYVLAELAEEYGVMVKDVSKARLMEAGLPGDLPNHVKLLAHKIHRDMVDAAHHRLRKEVEQ